MDIKRLQLVQAGGAGLIAIAYFLPWASIMSPLGSLELRGLYVDYAWLMLIAAILYLTFRFASANKEAFGIPEPWLKYMDLSERILPFGFAAFFVWYGATFAFKAQIAAAGRSTSWFGTTFDSPVRAGLDYGYWLGCCGALSLIASVGLLTKNIHKFAATAAAVAAVTLGLAFGFTRSQSHVQKGSAQTLGDWSSHRTDAATDTANNVTAPEPDLDAAPYVQVVSITGRRRPKDYEARRYSNSVWIYPRFKNVCNKTIVGLRGRISLTDGFGKEVYEFGFRDDNKLLPDYESRSVGGYSFNENEFMSDDPYSKMVPLIIAGTAKYSARITQIAFDDGTVLPKKQ